MFGTKIRSWMEAHIVRARKKQTRTKNKSKETPPAEEKAEDVQSSVPKDNSAYSVGKTEVNGVSLSSPESAYSTGYSTDGTSPGASVPPEYYINLRTGKHYVQAMVGAARTITRMLHSVLWNNAISRPNKKRIFSTFVETTRTYEAETWSLTSRLLSMVQAAEMDLATGNTAVSGGVGPEGRSTPGRRRREEAKRWRAEEGLPGSSTEEDIADRTANTTHHQRVVTPKVQRKSVGGDSLLPPYQQHRRTESYDGSQRFQQQQAERDSEGSSSQTTGPSLSPFPAASPRQRNRIRTNPWLGDKAGYSGETSSTVGSSSTLSSTGARPPPREELTNLNLLRSQPYIPSPLLNNKRVVHTVTTCSPQPNRPCRHIRLASSSSTSARSSGSDRGNASDFSDDDLTLNEILGKYDESYVYEKETDILSDSDPTDCEEQPDYNDNSSRQASERQDDLDFIDTGSIAELAISDSEQTGKFINRGHCSFVSSANHTPEMCKRQCSRLRRQRGEGSAHSSRGSSLSNRRVRRSSSRRSDDSEATPRRYRKKRQSSKDSRKSVESLPKEPPPPRVFKPEPRPPEPQGRHMNLNRVLMERLIQNQRSGTRSADGTPVSLRRNEYNGKYLRNPHVSKLISSNSLIEKRANSEEKHFDIKETSTIKKRSNSVSGTGPTPPPVPARTYMKGHNPIDKEGDMKYRKLIQEAEHIFEDFHVRSGRPEYLSPTLSTRSAIFPAPKPPPQPYMFSRVPNEEEINSQIDLLQETINNNSVPKLENEEGIFKTISKTLEKIIIRNADIKKTDKVDKNSDTIKSKKAKNQNKAIPFETVQNKPVPFNPIQNKPVPFNAIQNKDGPPLSIFNHSETVRIAQENDYVNNPIPIPLEALPDSNDNLYKDYSYTPSINNENARSFNENLNSNYERGYRNKKGLEMSRGFDDAYPFPSSPKMIPTNKNRKTKDLSSSWHGRRAMAEMMNQNGNEFPQANNPLTSFKSFDLGNKVDTNAKYCPQSEPVKRKVYMCSSTFDKLQKSLMRDSNERHYEVPDLPTEALRDENTTLKEKVAQLRRERLQVEARVRETQEQIDRLRLEASSHC